MKNKVAILFYGQPRLIPECGDVLNRLKRAFSRTAGTVDFVNESEDNCGGGTAATKSTKTPTAMHTSLDIYVHTWKNIESDSKDYLYDFIIKEYKPKRILIEDSQTFDPELFLNKETLDYNKTNGIYTNQDISNFISQLVSVRNVCSLITPEIKDSYDYFVLTRFDLFLSYFDKDKFEEILSSTNFFSNTKSTVIDLDIIQIFNKSVLNIYVNELFPFIKKKVFENSFFPELLRFSVLIDKGYTFYGNLYLERFRLNYFENIKMKKIDDLMRCQLIREKKDCLENVLDLRYLIAPVWFLSSCGFLFFHIEYGIFFVNKLKKHSSYTEKFDFKVHLKDISIKKIKVYDVWYDYDYRMAMRLISGDDEFTFEIGIDTALNTV